MKLYQLFFLAFLAVVPTLKAAVEYDLKKGVDLTATNVINTTILNQLVDTGTVGQPNKGVVIRRSSGGGVYWPSVTDNPRYTNFLWLDTYTSPGILKQYTNVGDAYVNWVSSTITPSSVTTAEILNGTILQADMANGSVGTDQLIAGNVTSLKLGDLSVVSGKISAAAVLQGNLADNSVTTASITNNAITTVKITDAAVDRNKLLASAVGHLQLTNLAVMAQHLSNDAVTATAILNATITTNKLAGDINRGLLNTNVSYNMTTAWAYLKADGTLMKAYNISAGTRLDAGDFKFTFATPMTSTNYVVSGMILFKTGTARIVTVTTNSTTELWIKTQNTGGTDTDDDLMISVLGGQF